MDKNEIIPLNNDRIADNTIKMTKKRKKCSILKRLLCLILIMGMCYFTYNNFSEIKVIVDNILNSFSSTNDNNNPPVSDIGTSDNLTSDNIIEDVPNDTIQIPNGSFSIIECTGKFTEIKNDAEINLDLDFSSTSYYLANDIYKKYGSEAPLVLIIHSSCLESYSNGIYYRTDDSFYSSKDNVADVGKLICDTLNNNNINAIHIDDIFANGIIFNSRAEFEKALENALKIYPSISYVLDISRDTLINDDLSMNKMITESKENDMAQIKITVGSSLDESKAFWHKNLAFANMLATENSDLIYDVTLCSFELSQDISPISMRIDVGAYSNTINEALLAGKELAIRLSDLLHEDR